jgi:hypothetical protein
VTPGMIFLGYRAAGVPPEASICRSARVEEICSIMGCMRGEPAGSVIRWERFNAASLYDTPEHAGTAVPAGVAFTVFGVRLLPMVFGPTGEETPMDVNEYFGVGGKCWPMDPGDAWESLGFDAVGSVSATHAHDGYAGSMAMWRCSPLSCNGMAAEYPVNRWCLLDTMEEARAAARRFGIEEPEPGPYVVVEVLRRKGEGAWAEVLAGHAFRHAGREA